MKVNELIVIKKNYKNSKFRSQVVELCRSGIFSDHQLLSQLKISRTSLKAWHRWYIRYRLGRWLRTKPRIPMKKESDELLALKQQLAAVEKENQRPLVAMKTLCELFGMAVRLGMKHKNETTIALMKSSF